MNFSFTFPGRAGTFAIGLLGIAVAQAAPAPAPQPGELFAGFRATDGQGSSTSYLIKLGQDTLFRSAEPGTEFEVAGLGNVGADLTSLFGAGWSTRVDVQWGIFGTRVAVNTTVYGSRARPTPTQPAAPWPELSISGRNAVGGAVTSVLEEIGGYKGSEATANSPVSIQQTNTSEASSYARQVGTPGTTDFSTLSQWTTIEAGFDGGPGAAGLDVFRIASTGVSLVGTFTINAAGTIRFSSAPPVTGGDTDGDGFSDDDEIAAGTDPADGSSLPQAQISLSESGPRIQAVTAANRTYTIEYSETLATGTWSAVGTHASGAAATPLDFVDADVERRAKGRGHYRVKIAP